MERYSAAWFNALAAQLVTQTWRDYRAPSWYDNPAFGRKRYQRRIPEAATWSFIVTYLDNTQKILAVVADNKDHAMQQIRSTHPDVCAIRWPKNHGSIPPHQVQATRNWPKRTADTIVIDGRPHQPEVIAHHTGRQINTVIGLVAMHKRIYGPDAPATMDWFRKTGIGKGAKATPNVGGHYKCRTK